MDLLEPAWAGELARVNTLLASGGRSAAQDRNGRTALHLAAKEGHAECIESLLAAGHSPAATDSSRHTPLHKAAANGHAACVSALAAHRATLESVDSDGRTALHLAARNGHVECATALLAACLACFALLSFVGGTCWFYQWLRCQPCHSHRPGLPVSLPWDSKVCDGSVIDHKQTIM